MVINTDNIKQINVFKLNNNSTIYTVANLKPPPTAGENIASNEATTNSPTHTVSEPLQPEFIQLSHRVKINSRIPYCIDCINRTLWGRKHKRGEIMKLYTASKEDRKKKKDIYVNCFIDFNEVTGADGEIITISAFDRAVYMAVLALYEDSNYFTLRNIFREMTPNGKIRADDSKLSKIKESIIKMNNTEICIDNTTEISNGYDYEPYKFRSNGEECKYKLLDFEFVTLKNNGRLTENSIHILSEPILLRFAKGRKQLINFTAQTLFNIPLSLTESILRTEYWIMNRVIAIQSNNKYSNTINITDMFNDICTAESNDNKRQQKHRFIPMVKEILQYFKDIEYIKDFEINTRTDRITIKVSKDSKTENNDNTEDKAEN